MFHLFTFQRFRWTIHLCHVLPSTFFPCFVDGVWFRYAPVHENAPFVDGMQKEALLFLLQCLGGVGAGGAESLPEDGEKGYCKDSERRCNIYPNTLLHPVFEPIKIP